MQESIVEKMRNLRAINRGFVVKSLILFIDNPEHAVPDDALNPDLVQQAGPEIYTAILDRLKNLTASFTGEKYLHYSHFPNWNDGWDINVYRKRLQTGNDEAGRLQAALEDLSEDHPESVLWMNVSAAAMEADQLQRAETALAETEVLIGETPSGRIILLGLRAAALNMELPAALTADAITERAAAGGLQTARIVLPEPPRSRDDFARLGINLPA